MKKDKWSEMKNFKNKSFKLPFIILVWVVMAMGIGSSIWLVRVLILIQIQGVYIANEPNPLILSSEIIFFIVGILISVIVMIIISKILLERIMYDEKE